MAIVEHKIQNMPNMPQFAQGSSNGCGTTSLAMVMSYLGEPRTRDQIDSEIRRMDIFSSPEDLVEYASDNGLRAEGYNNGRWEDVKSFVDNNHPMICMFYATYTLPSGGKMDGLHYAVITGYGVDSATSENYVLLRDPNGADLNPLRLSEFQVMWEGVGWGFHHYYMAFGPWKSKLPQGNNDGVEGQLGALDGVTNITNGIDRVIHPDSFGSFVHGLFFQLPAGIIQTIGAGIGGLIQIGGQKLNDAVEGIPVIENLVQPIGDILNGVGAILGDVFNAVGSAIDNVGQAFEDLFSGDFSGFAENIGDAVADVVQGAVDAIGDAISAVGDAISDFFSGW